MRIFRYEEAWDLREECSKTIQDNWIQGQSTIHKKLATCRQALVRWRKVIQIEEEWGKQQLIS